MELGVAFSSEELGPNEIVRYTARAEEAGFGTGWVSDHFHPWIDAQGSSPFVWSVLGGVAHATEAMRFGSGVTCPTVRMHPAVIAQAAATAQCMFDGRFWLGVGSGEALNEHIVGAKWPEATVRLAMLEEAIEVIRKLWQGEQQSHYGNYFTVENARIYTLPENLPPIIVSAFAEASVALAARCGDGLVSTKPDADLVQQYEQLGGRGPKLAQLKVVWADSAREAEDLAYRLLHREDIVGAFPCGPDPQKHIDAIMRYRGAGYDEIYVTQIGPHQEGFLRFYEREILPAFRGSGVGAYARA
jgi:coenzyme F420-dependent glucose-6-phosphate dehydrogenase